MQHDPPSRPPRRVKAIRRPSGDQTAVNGMYGSNRNPLPSALTRYCPTLIVRPSGDQHDPIHRYSGVARQPAQSAAVGVHDIEAVAGDGAPKNAIFRPSGDQVG